jgi:hypothetical protein
MGGNSRTSVCGVRIWQAATAEVAAKQLWVDGEARWKEGLGNSDAALLRLAVGDFGASLKMVPLIDTARPPPAPSASCARGGASGAGDVVEAGVGDVGLAARHLFYAMCLLDWRDGTIEEVVNRRDEAIRHLEQSIAVSWRLCVYNLAFEFFAIGSTSAHLKVALLRLKVALLCG